MTVGDSITTVLTLVICIAAIFIPAHLFGKHFYNEVLKSELIYSLLKLQYDPEVMKKAATSALKSSTEGIGGPFGAAIVHGSDVIVAFNTVLKSHDPTAHAEVNAIRKASAYLGTHDLSDCVLYATSAPCPMCRAAILWSNIKTVYYSNSEEDAANIGFRDQWMYDYFENGSKDASILQTMQVESEDCKLLLKEYSDSNLELY